MIPKDNKGPFIPIMYSLLIYFVFIFTLVHGKEYIPEKFTTHNPMRINVIGAGYVGLVLSAGLAEFGHTVLCTDIDHEKIDALQNGVISIYEPDLEKIIKKNIENHRLSFSPDITHGILENDILFIAVGTPMGSGGKADLTAVESVAKTIGQHLNHHKIICVKSTIPIGSGKRICEIIKNESKSSQFEFLNCPEFLREGSALSDFFEPDRIVFGITSELSKHIMDEVFEPLKQKGIPFLYTNIESAETIKYASNAFLAVKISFINEIAHLCDITGADIQDVSLGIGLDHRIGLKFLNPGPGYGGSCFPKDTAALQYTAKTEGVTLQIPQAAEKVNAEQKQRVVDKLVNILDGEIENKTIAILGLAFKANTDDVRFSPAIDIIEQIIKKGGIIRAYDPIAIKNMRRILPEIEYVDSLYQAVDQADAAVILTEWNEFLNMDLQKVKHLMNQPILLDSRNILNAAKLSKLGFKYQFIGKPSNL